MDIGHMAKSLWVKVAQLCLTLCDPTDYTIHGILQARILEWVAFPFSRGSSQLRDWTQVSCTADGFFTSLATRETQSLWESSIIFKKAKVLTSKTLKAVAFKSSNFCSFCSSSLWSSPLFAPFSSCWGSITLSWRWPTPFLGAVEYIAGLASLMGLQGTWSSMAPDKHLPVTGHPVRSPPQHSSWTCRSLFPSFIYWQFCVNLKNETLWVLFVCFLFFYHLPPGSAFLSILWLGLKASLLPKGLQGFIISLNIPELGDFTYSLSRAENVMPNSSFSLHLKVGCCLQESLYHHIPGSG